MEKLAYVQPTLDKVVLTTNERIAACEGVGSIDSPPVPIPDVMICELEEPS